ncbi:hypothetical protein [Microcoleus sp. F4-D5]|uniref:hypothetical protein n=1 Tax=Microcoleus sp. F4-D5 TaxID=2818760 RepID=UPI002FD6FE0E
MSEAVNKFIELIKQGCVQHDGMLNPIARSEAKKPGPQKVHSANEAIGVTATEPKPPYWTQVLTRKDMIERGFSAYKLDNMRYGTFVPDGYNRLWWKEAIYKGLEAVTKLLDIY